MDTHTFAGVTPKAYGFHDPSFDTREAFLLRFAAPAGSGREGFRFQQRPGRLTLWRDAARGTVCPFEPQAVARAAGASIFDLRVAAARFGAVCEVAYTPEPILPELLAEIRFGETRRADESLAALFPAMLASPRMAGCEPCRAPGDATTTGALRSGELLERQRLETLPVR
jgi:hypothetical protein